MKHLLPLLFLFSIGSIFAQPISVSTTQTPQQLVDNVLLGFGVTAFNVTINGNPALANTAQGNVGYFTNTNPLFPINNGLVLTTGNAAAAVGPNSGTSFTNNNPPTSSVSTDPHLNDIAAGSVTNGVVLEFDFIPSGDTLVFNYMFGSDEYPEFSPSSFNDAFGLFLWGPGISGPFALAGYPNGGQNIATIPGGIPVTINNVGDVNNTQYYVFNESSSTLTYGDAIQYDGTTVLLTAAASVQCNQLYHIKLAISNVGDQSYDSGVFLEAGSFSSAAVDVAVATVSGDTTIVEGCTYADFIFTRPPGQLNDTLIINYTIGGVAQQGIDYNTLPNPITFLPGEDTVIINLTPTQDGINEGFESVVITVQLINPCGDTITSSGTIYIGEGPIINISGNNPTVFCATDSVWLTASASGGYAPYDYSWENLVGVQLGTNDSISVGISQNGTMYYLVTATDNCNFTQTDTVTITMNQTLAIDTIYIGPSTCVPTGYVSVQATGLQGVPQYTWTGPGPNGFIDASVWQNIPSGWYYITVEDNVCSVSDSAFVDLLDPPVAQFSASITEGCETLNVTFNNSSQNAQTYAWDFGNGQTSNSAGPVSMSYDATQSPYVVTLTALQGAQCTDQASATITVFICGCTNPEAINYNPLATVDDGTCIVPEPVVIAPNVFSPNADNNNELFYLNVKNVTTLQLTILNRWGNVVFEKSSVNLINDNPSWDGKIDGELATEGIYFYTYLATGINGQEVTGHGFLHLVNKK
ncbi:MAG: choice-of-anchor L domain-containing protein [Flavobacteriales bacterium]